jgi:hypothetical protein
VARRGGSGGAVALRVPPRHSCCRAGRRRTGSSRSATASKPETQIERIDIGAGICIQVSAGDREGDRNVQRQWLTRYLRPRGITARSKWLGGRVHPTLAAVLQAPGPALRPHGRDHHGAGPPGRHPRLRPTATHGQIRRVATRHPADGWLRGCSARRPQATPRRCAARSSTTCWPGSTPGAVAAAADHGSVRSGPPPGR